MTRSRIFLIAAAVFIGFQSFSTTPIHAAPPDKNAPRQNPALAAAQTALELATLQYRRYELVEYPLKLRRLESEIKLTAAEMASHERLIAEYNKFRIDKSNPFVLSLEQANLARLAAKLRLDDLKEEKLLLERYHSEQRRIYEIEVETAQQRLESVKSER